MPEAAQDSRRRPLNSLATRIILFVFVATLVTAGAVTWTALQATYRHLGESLGREHARALEAALPGVRALLEEGRDALGALARSGPGRTAAQRLIEGDDSPFDGIARLDADGTLRFALGSVSELPEGALAQIVEAGGLASLRAADATSTAAAVAPVEGGRLVARFDTATVAARLATAQRFTDSEVLLVDAHGRVLQAVHRPADALARLSKEHSIDSDDAAYSGAATGPMVDASRPLALGAGWQVVVETPFDVAYGPLRQIVIRLFVLDLVIVLVFSLVAYRMTNAAVRPIESLSDAARRIGQGQFDHEIPDVPRHDEIGLLTRTLNDMMQRFREYQNQIERDNVELQRQKEQFEQLSITDGLTGLHNHRFFQEHLAREIKRVTRTREPLAILLIDIDDFKALNDRMGHAAGDELLMRMARTMQGCVRDSDLLARYGGEEFVVLASNTDRGGAHLLAEKLRTEVAEGSFILDDSLRPTRVTVSVGVAQYDGNRKKFFEAADRALYRAKAEGKNCVVVDEPAPIPDPP